MGNLGMFPFMFRGVLSSSDSLDDIKKTGFYFSDNDVARGIIIVVTYSYGTIQIIGGSGGAIRMRVFWGNWFNWHTIS